MTERADDRPSPPETPAPPRRAGWRRVARSASLAAAAAAVTAGVCVAIGGALWRSEGGTRWLLQHVPGLTVVDVRGSFGGGDVRIGSLRALEPGVQVDVTNLSVTGLDLRWHPHLGAWVGASFTAWMADAVRVTPLPSQTPAAATAPTSLRSPVALDVASLRVGSLAIGTGAPLRDVRAALAIGADGGRLHRVDHLRFGWERVEAEGTLVARTDAPLALDVTLAAHDAPQAAPAAASAAPLPHWAASATLRGPLAGFDLVANLQGEPRPGRAAPQASASAHVTPFASLPVSEVFAKTTELDLRALSDGAPATRLQGTLRLATTKPAALDADLRNLAPAAWSAGGLPFASLTGHLEAPWSGQSIAIPSLRLVLADDKGAGGELRAQGRWEGGKAQLQLDLDQVQPARLDAHLGAWRISGPLRAEFEHLPAPASLWGGAAASAPGAAKPASAAPDGWLAHVTGKLGGTAPPLGSADKAVTPPPMALQLDALLRADALQLKQFDLKAGPAAVSATGALSRARNDTWQGDARAQWSQLDPGAWWRLADSGPLRDGPNVLNGSLTLHLAGAPAAWQGLAGIHGKADLALTDSLLAGLALDGTASVDALGAPWAVSAEVHSGGNQARVDGAISPGNAGADALAVVDQLHLSVDAPALQLLAPPTARSHAASPAVAAASAVDRMAQTKTIPGELIAKAATQVASGGKTDDPKTLVPAAAASAASAARAAEPAAARGLWVTRGSARLDVQVTGGRLAIADGAHGRRGGAAPLRIVTQGELSDWVGPRFKLARLQWSGHGSSDPQAPLDASITLVDAQMGVARIAHAQATLAGTLARHQLQLQGEAPVSPPPWLAHLANIGNANATRLDASLQGLWQPGAVNAPAWQGHLAQFDLRAANEANAATPPGPAASAPTVANPNWVHVEPFDLSLSRDAAGDWQTLRVGAGLAEFAGLTLNWQPSFWTAPAAPGASARWAVDAALAPFSVAQLLARAQPDLGWHGDLQMTAQVHAAFDGRWHVAAQVARSSGDLSVTELVQDPTASKQALGLSRALFSVKAEGVNWTADADVAGSRLGELAGHWTAEAPSPASLPTAGSPLHGNVKAHVEDLNVWGAWLPPGWRLGGELRTDLALSGRWGDPKLTGEITATRLAIRNALEGIYGHDGEAAIRLTGDQAQIERFRLQGGNGELSLTGSASLGAVPLAKLQLQASQFQLLGRIDRKIVTTGNLALQLGADAIKVDGKLAIDEGLFDLSKGDAPSLDSDVEVLDAGAPADDGGDAAAASVPRTGRATQINLAVDLGDRLKLRGRGIDTTLKGALQITSPNGLLAVRGTVRTAGGQYVAYGQKLDVTRGEISFTGPVNDPRLDILAVRPNLDIVVGVAITGTALAPHVRLMSEPDMSDTDKLSWLMLGRAPETVGGADTALLQQAAMALLAGEGEAPSDQVLKRLGLTDFAVGQKSDADNVKQTVVTLGRQVSKRIYVGYERSVTATAGNWQLIYRIAQRLTIRAQAGVDTATISTTNATTNQSWSLDAIYTWKWN
jgi:translocation and assembly module TamB